MQAMPWDSRPDSNAAQPSSRREQGQQPQATQGWSGPSPVVGAMQTIHQSQSSFLDHESRGHPHLGASALDGSIDPSNLTSTSNAGNQMTPWPSAFSDSSGYQIINDPHHFRPQHVPSASFVRDHEDSIAQSPRPELLQHVSGATNYRLPSSQEFSPRSRQVYPSLDTQWTAYPRHPDFLGAIQAPTVPGMGSAEPEPMAPSPMAFRRSWAPASSPKAESQSYHYHLDSTLHISGVPSMAFPIDASASSSASRLRHGPPDESFAHSRNLQFPPVATGSEDLSSIPELVDRRRSSGSLSEQYAASDEQRAQEILKMLRSRAPDSKEGVAACDYCRKRRIKCDREKPTCGRCAIAGRVCTTSDTLRKRGPPSKKEREYLAAQGIQFVPSRVRRRSAAMEKADEQAPVAFLSSTANPATAIGPGQNIPRGTLSGPTSGLNSPELSPPRSGHVGPQRLQPSSSRQAIRRQRSDTVPGSIFFEYSRHRLSHDGGGGSIPQSSSPKVIDGREIAQRIGHPDHRIQYTQTSQGRAVSGGVESEKTGQQKGVGSNEMMGDSKLPPESQPHEGQNSSATALVLNQYGVLEGLNPASFPSTVTELVRTSRKGEEYWASMNMSSANITSILAFSERLLRHDASRYLILSYFKNYHNRFPFAYEPWIWQAMETAQSGSSLEGKASPTKLAPGTQALLLSIIAMSSCTAEPWQVNDGQSVNLWWFGHAAHRACMAIVDPPFLHDKNITDWARYTDSFLSPDLAQSFILVGGYLMNEGPEAVWRSIRLGWDICTRQGFHRSRADVLQRGSMARTTAAEICKEQGLRAVWALMKLSVTIYLTGRIATWPRFLVEFDADLPGTLHDPSDPEHQELHLNPEALESWSSAMPINRLLLRILTSPLSPEWAQHQHQQAGQPGSVPMVSVDEKRRLLHDFDVQIAQWKRDAECLKAHRAMPLTRSGDEDYAWSSVNSKTRVILRIAEERLSEAHQRIIAEADRTGQAVSDEERKVALRRVLDAGAINATGGGQSGLPVTDRVSAWFQTVEDDNLAWYCGTVPAGSSSSSSGPQ